MEKIAVRAITAIALMFSINLLFGNGKAEGSIEINPRNKGSNNEKQVSAN